MGKLAVTIPACLAVAVVLGTDVFFTVVGRTALTRASASAMFEVMGQLHRVADRRMPVFGAVGLVGAGLLAAIAPQVRIFAAVSLVAQLIFLALYLTVAKPINTRMSSAIGTAIEPGEARALQARWESILVARSTLLALALCSLLLALAQKG